MSKKCLTREGYGLEETRDLEEEKDAHSSREDSKCISPEARTQRNGGKRNWHKIKRGRHTGIPRDILLTAKTAPRFDCGLNPGSASPEGTQTQKPA